MDPESERSALEPSVHPAQEILRKNAPDYPPELLEDLFRYGDKAAQARQRMEEAWQEGDRETAEAEYNMATFYENYMDWRLKRFHRRQRIRRISHSVSRLLSFGHTKE